jgi:hypothetical protein
MICHELPSNSKSRAVPVYGGKDIPLLLLFVRTRRLHLDTLDVALGQRTTFGTNCRVASPLIELLLTIFVFATKNT